MRTEDSPPLISVNFADAVGDRGSSSGGEIGRTQEFSGPSWSLPQATKHANDNHDGHR